MIHDADDLIEFAKEWVDLGDAIQTQVEYIVNVQLKDQDEHEVNPNAIKHAKRSGVYGWTGEIDHAIDEYLAENERREEIEDIRSKMTGKETS